MAVLDLPRNICQCGDFEDIGAFCCGVYAAPSKLTDAAADGAFCAVKGGASPRPSPRLPAPLRGHGGARTGLPRPSPPLAGSRGRAPPGAHRLPLPASRAIL
ncbi:hypothetical protein M885DRAFT_128521 [Pelagophyceae sp. CCMP2097]|nr:hypothetical protein M885DRAFT_128521 [Pelagophyceae sp. CCMP2097]